MYNFRTDLALERRDVYKKANNIKGEIDGILSKVKKTVIYSDICLFFYFYL